MATFYNQAAFSYNGNTINSNITTGEIVQSLSADKTSLLPTYSPNGVVTYVISITNDSNSAFTDLIVTDDLGAYETAEGQTVYPLDIMTESVKYFINGEEQPAPTVTAEQPLTLDGIDIPAEGNAVIVYQAMANSFASPAADGSITNTAVISGAALTEDMTVSATVTAVQQPVISMVKTLSPTTVSENSQVTYSFTVYNYGNTEVAATDNAVITDTFTPALRDITVTMNGQTKTTGYSYDEVSGLLTTSEGVITVPAATISQDPVTGEYAVVPGTVVITVTGTI
ncbi:hypothetical protein [Ruminococcus sp.]|uniref:hypothetical protein n=1 Tax=Ruminococcus sp. TaxID=41978 RepID=UPI0025F60541|nr:hypothetical protein [Ruminococcus sp.]MBQ9541602.1 hypothetical protein [Ruminococcus sp.]